MIYLIIILSVLLSTINYLGIMPTRFNLAKRNIIADNGCPIYIQCPETEVHVLWDCPAAQDVWAGSRIKLQKCPLGQQDMVQLLAYLMDRLEPEEVELFLVQAWIIWNQRNSVLRAEIWMEEIAQAQQHLSITPERHEGNVWRPPPPPFFKLNFDAAIIKERSTSGFGAMIRNEQGEVMAALSAIGPSVSCSEEAETMACRKAVEFTVDAGFSELMIEGDSVNVMKAISSSIQDLSVAGNVVADIQWIIRGLRRVPLIGLKGMVIG